MLKEIFSMAIYNIGSRKLRSGLTLLGIIIGVAAVIATLSLGIGMQANLVDQFNKFQGDVISVVPGKLRFTAGPATGAGEVIKLTDKDLDAIKQTNNVAYAIGSVRAEAKVEYKDNIGKLTIAGIDDPDTFQKIETSLSEIEDGRWFTADEKGSVVVGYSVAHEVFPDEIALKKTIVINGKEFRVVGIAKKAGGFMASFDSSIYMPLKSARDIFPGQFETNEYASISAKVDHGADIEVVASDIEEKLLNIHKQTKDTETFTLVTPKFFQDQINGILSSFTSFLMMLGVISLIIGGIGIMNIMYVSVMERTREIGTMKAIGATNRTIQLMFIFEAGFFGLLGGIVGDILGIGMSYGFASFLSSMGNMGSFFAPYVGLDVMALGLVFGFVVGIVAGYFPARRASKLQPVEALRYE